MDLVVELNNEDTKRKKFQVFKNVSFDPRVIPAIVYWTIPEKKKQGEVEG